MSTMELKGNQLTIYRSGASALIGAFCDLLKIPELIDKTVAWDPTQCHLSPGTRIKAMIINMLVDRRALFGVHEFYQDQDCAVLFGPGVSPDDFNDDALGRALDKLAEIDLNRLYSSGVVSFLTAQGQSVGRLHIDTSSISVEGAYDGEGDLKITYGYSKDHRPDLKQFLLGMAVTPQGLPIMGQPLDGNRSDKTWYLEAMEHLKGVMTVEQLRSVIFVADSALVSHDAWAAPQRMKNGTRRISLRQVT